MAHSILFLDLMDKHYIKATLNALVIFLKSVNLMICSDLKDTLTYMTCLDLKCTHFMTCFDLKNILYGILKTERHTMSKENTV